MGDVITRAGQFDQAQIALNHDHLRHRRDRREAEPCGDFALGDLASASQARFLGMLEDKLIEAAGIGQHPAHDQRVGDRLDPVGEADLAIGRQEADLSQFAAGQTLGRGGVGVDLGELHFAGAAGEKLDDRDVIDRRLGVGQRHHRGDPTGSGGLTAALDRLHVLGAGLAQLDAHVDEAGREAEPREIDDLDVVADGLAKLSAERRDPVVLDQEIAGRV